MRERRERRARVLGWELPPFLTPVTSVVRPDPGEPVRPYLRSYLFMRMMVGFLGLALPLILMGLDRDVRDSVSVYYYSSGDGDVFSARDMFVGTLCAIGAFLITYKAFERNLDNTLSIVGGLTVLIVAFVPSKTSHVHHVSAGLFIATLGVLCFFFSVQEGNRGTEGVAPEKRWSPRPWRTILVRYPMFWRNFHFVCSCLILLSLIFLTLRAVSQWQDWGEKGLFWAELVEWNNGVFWGEFVAVSAFGASWLAKGSELDMLFPGKPAP